MGRPHGVRSRVCSMICYAVWEDVGTRSRLLGVLGCGIGICRFPGLGDKTTGFADSVLKSRNFIRFYSGLRLCTCFGLREERLLERRFLRGIQIVGDQTTTLSTHVQVDEDNINNDDKPSLYEHISIL